MFWGSNFAVDIIGVVNCDFKILKKQVVSTYMGNTQLYLKMRSYILHQVKALSFKELNQRASMHVVEKHMKQLASLIYDVMVKIDQNVVWEII